MKGNAGSLVAALRRHGMRATRCGRDVEVWALSQPGHSVPAQGVPVAAGLVVAVRQRWRMPPAGAGGPGGDRRPDATAAQGRRRGEEPALTDGRAARAPAARLKAAARPG